MNKIKKNSDILDLFLSSSSFFKVIIEVSDRDSISADTQNQMTRTQRQKNLIGTSLLYVVALMFKITVLILSNSAALLFRIILKDPFWCLSNIQVCFDWSVLAGWIQHHHCQFLREVAIGSPKSRLKSLNDIIA